MGAKVEEEQMESERERGKTIKGDGDCSHEIKRRLLLERKVMTNLDSTCSPSEICQTGMLIDSSG